MNRKLRHVAKRIAEPLGLDDFIRQTVVEILLSGERLKFAINGRPPTSTTILLAGSGRSGTTWITDVLCALPGIQQIFEPLFPPWNPEVRALTGWDSTDPYFRAHYLRPDATAPQWESLLFRVLAGQIRNYWTDYYRTSFLPERFLIKEVRANLMLGYIYRRFCPRLVYIMRHPCAVIHSRLSAPEPWHADVDDILHQEELVDDYLHPWLEQIQQERDLLGAHAVWWAVENCVALDQLKRVPHFLVYYEDLVLHPHQVLEKLFQWLGYPRCPQEVDALLNRPSRMTHADRNSQSNAERLARWQHQLSSRDQQRILAWTQRLGLEMYDRDTLPR